MVQQIDDELKRQLTLLRFGINGFVNYARSKQGDVYQYSRSIILAYYTHGNTKLVAGSTRKLPLSTGNSDYVTDGTVSVRLSPLIAERNE
jgi:hypothetical protein